MEPFAPNLDAVIAGEDNFSLFAAATLRRLAERLPSGEIPVRCAKARGLWNTRCNWPFHLFPEFFFQLRGGCHFDFPHQKLDLVAGELLIVPTGLPHRETPFRHHDREFTNLVLMACDGTPELHLAVPHPPRSTDPPLSCRGRRLEPVPGFAPLLAALAAEAEPKNPLLRHAQLHIIAALLFQLAAGLEAPPCPQPAAATLHPKVSAAMHYVLNTFPGSTPDVRSVARAVRCSPNYLSGLFRRETGGKLNDYINSIRLDYAKKMLQTTNHKVAEIAWSCGFQDAAYFAELYRSVYHLSPSMERK